MDADRLETVCINGWRCVCGKGIFHKGDIAIFFEIDSKLPEVEPFIQNEFLKNKKFKIKSQKIRGVISQGLLMHPDEFGWTYADTQFCGGVEIVVDDEGKEHFVDDESRFLTEKLGVTYAVTEDNIRKAPSGDKYKKMAQRHPKLAKTWWWKLLYNNKVGKKILFAFFGKKRDKGNGWPSFIKRTDEERVQNCTYLLNDTTETWYPTEKIDGCLDKNCSIVTENGIFKISEIVNKKMNTRVLTYNENLDTCEYCEIEGYHKWERVSDMYDVVVRQVGYRCGNREKHIRCTSNHSFYSDNGVYIKASELSEGMPIYHRKISMDKIAKQILIGILLGDGSLSARYSNITGSVDFSHCEKQKDYFFETSRLLGVNCTYRGTTSSGYGSLMHNAHYISNYEFKLWANKNCFRDGKKYVTKEWANELSPISLAFWYMDDGTLMNAEEKNTRPRIHIATNAFSLDECENLKQALKTKFNIEVTILTKDCYKGNVLCIDVENTEKFCELIAPYVVDSMKYKLPKHLRTIEYSMKNYVCKDSGGIIRTEVVRVNKIEGYDDKYVYDLTISKNHNYFACGILTHNTSTTFSRKGFGRKKQFYVCSRNVPFTKPDQKCFYETNIYIEMAEKYDMENKLNTMIEDHKKERPDVDFVTIQAETYGSGVQRRDYGLKEHDMAIFNVIFGYKDGSTIRLNPVEGKKFADKYNLPYVPVLNEEGIHLPNSCDEVLKMAEDEKSKLDGGMREGIVFRSKDGTKSFKAVSNEFLLKYHG